MEKTRRPAFANADRVIKKTGIGIHLERRKSQIIFSQGDRAGSVFYIKRGKVKMTVLSKRKKEAVVAILGVRNFFGEGCLAGQPLRMATATAVTDCSVIRFAREKMKRLLRSDQEFSEIFAAHLLSRNVRVEESLVDQLFNSPEKKLARALLVLANFGKLGKPKPVIPPVDPGVLAEMIGTTRSKVNLFMNKFRKLGFIAKDKGGLRLRSSLLSFVLRD